ncbi:hypothetical protein G9P44_000975 [Scheffersomyces stipitis]|nr:hypothetical protein G9P44_000975 [Scheffersomyces stipitis]
MNNNNFDSSAAIQQTGEAHGKTHTYPEAEVEEPASIDIREKKDKMDDNSESSHIDPQYSILKPNEKRCMVFLLSCSGIWSTLSSSIYFPALPALSEKFSVSPGIVNLSVVAYLLFQGFCPTLLATVADTYGRRPCILMCLTCYAAVCVALSRVNVYWLLAVLRCLQAGAIAPIIAVGSGVMGDICTPAERGGYIGMMGGFLLVGQGFGGLVGAAVVSGFGWRGVFVLLAIGSGFALILCFLVLPETSRNIVGNLSVPPPRFVNASPITHAPFLKKRMTNDISTIAETKKSNIFASYKIFFQKRVFFTLLPSGLQFATWTMSLTTLSTSLEVKYGFSTIQVGLCYLAPGLGTLIGSIATGKVLDYIYSRKIAAFNKKYGHLPPESRPAFDIFTSRIQFTVYPSIVLTMFSVVFGWCIQEKVNLAPVLIAAFIMSFCAVSFMSALNTLLVDMFPGQGSAATSCLNLMRCLLGAAGVGALQSMVDRMGEGGTYTLMAGFCAISATLLFYLAARGRKRREAEEEAKLQQ